MAKETKSNAELAREERKARIEKTSKKQAEKKEKKARETARQKRRKVIIPVVIVVIALLVAGLYYFGVFHRTLSVVKYDNGSKVSVAEYEYYYKYVYRIAYYYSNMYDYYGDGLGVSYTGFDCSSTPKNQEYNDTAEYFMSQIGLNYELDEDTYGDSPTWADAIKVISLQMCKEINAIYDAAIEDGYELSDDDITAIDDEIEDLRETAKDNNYGLTAYLMTEYGRGMNESCYRELREKQTIASNYLTDKQTEYTNGITDEEVQAEYDANPGDYQEISLYYYSFTAAVATNTEAVEATDTTEAVEATNYTDEELDAMTAQNKEDAKAKANAFLSAASSYNFASLCYQYTDDSDSYKEYYNVNSDSYTEEYFLASGLSQSDLESYFNEDVGTWAFDSSRVAGDKNVFEISNDDGSTTYYIFLINTAATRDDTLQPRSVRHILIKTTGEQEVTDDDGNTTTETVEIRTMEEAKAEAEKILTEWQSGDATEASFIELVTKYSEDSGSSSDGGLYENIDKTGTDEDSNTYVTPFVDWMYAEDRKVGDVGIVEITSDDSSTYQGYHIMYLSAISDKTGWQQTIINTLASTKYNDAYNAIITDESYNATITEKLLSRIQNRLEDYAAKLIAAQAEEEETTTTATSTDE